MEDLLFFFVQAFIRNIHQEQVTIAHQHEYVLIYSDEQKPARALLCSHLLSFEKGSNTADLFFSS